LRAVVAGLAMLWASHLAWAEMATRLSDGEMKELFEVVDETRDEFEDHLDSTLKDSIIRSPLGEVKIEAFLDDLEDNVEKLDERFESKYAASREAAIVLEQGSALQRYFDRRDPQLKGMSEFDRFAAALSKLAAAYGVSFPLAPGDAPRRYNDEEVAALASQLATRADALEDAVDDDDSLDNTSERSAKSSLDQLEKAAKAVESRVSDGKPASAEARQVIDLGADIGRALASRRLSSETAAAWTRLREDLHTFQRAFGV
jgi:hypothetical protein